MKGRNSVAFSAYAKLNFKIIVVGQKAVGKTSLIVRYVKDSFSKTMGITQNIQFYSNTVSIENDEVALQIWDTVGSQHFKNVMKSFYQQASCVLITYSNPQSHKKTIENFMLELNQYAHTAVKIIIARTKTDETPITQDQKSYLDQLVERQDSVLLWRAVSAKTGEQVDNLFQVAAKDMFKRYLHQPDFKELVDPKKDSFLLNERGVPERRKSGCCK